MAIANLPQKNSSKAPGSPSTRSSPEMLAELSAMVSKLLSHYWTADDPPTLRKAQIADWLEDLREFPLGIVANAIREWRHAQTRRPTIADIRKLCIAEQWQRAEHYAVVDQRRERWPQWLEEIWGPEPEGPRKRAAAAILAGKTNP